MRAFVCVCMRVRVCVCVCVTPKEEEQYYRGKPAWVQGPQRSPEAPA